MRPLHPARVRAAQERAQPRDRLPAEYFGRLEQRQAWAAGRCPSAAKLAEMETPWPRQGQKVNPRTAPDSTGTVVRR